MADEEKPEEEAQDDEALAAEWAAAAEEGGEGVAAAAGENTEEAVYEVPVEISAVLGTAHIPVSQLLKMGRGAVMELDRLVGDPVDIYVDKQMVAHGEVVVVDDKIGVTLHDTIKAAPV